MISPKSKGNYRTINSPESNKNLGILDISAIDPMGSIHHTGAGDVTIMSGPERMSKSPNTRLLYLSNQSQTENKPMEQKKAYQRLAAYSNFKNNIYNANKFEVPPADKYDGETGQRLFKPKINQKAKLIMGRHKQPS